jgi:hypothetical protein
MVRARTLRTRMPRTPRHHLLAAVALAAACAAGCARPERAAAPPGVTEVTPAFLAGRAAADPSIASDGGARVAITWVERDSSGRADVWLSASSDTGATFAPPVRLNPAPGRVSSYAESRPVLAMDGRGTVAVAWAAPRDSGDTFDDLVARISRDGGATFDSVRVLNDDHANPHSTYHGFAALDVAPDGSLHAAWIDGRAAAGQPGEPAAAEIYTCASRDQGATWSANVRAADSVCACCRLAMRAGDGGRVALAYRTMRGNLRDPRLALSQDGGASFALDTLLSADGWRLDGCPSHGPSLALFEGGGHAAWFTGAPPGAGLFHATWRDDGGLAHARRPLDAGYRNAGRPALAPFGRRVLAGFVGVPLADTARRVFAVGVLAEDGAAGPRVELGVRAKTAALAPGGARFAWACWVDDAGDGPRLRVARLDLGTTRD